MKCDLTGKKFGRLTAVSYLGDCKWRCLCDCGNETVVYAHNLKSGNSKSCGCLHKGHSGVTHGGSRSRLHRIWCHMKDRCYNQNCKAYKWYGKLGVSVCSEWVNDFPKFREWAISNGYRDDLTIDRINPFGNYEPINCRWISLCEQATNKRKHYLEVQ